MDGTGGDNPDLFSNVGETDKPGSAELECTAGEDQRRGAGSFTSWLGGLSLREYLSAILALGQARAGELRDTVQGLPIVSKVKASAVALGAYSQAVGSRAVQTRDRAAESMRNLPEVTASYAFITALALVALMGGRDWDSHRDSLDCCTLQPGEPRYSWGRSAPPPPDSTTVTPPVSPTGDGDIWPPKWVSTLRAQPPAIFQQPSANQPATEVAKQTADLATQYLAQFLGGTREQYPAMAPVPSFAAMARRTGRTSAERAVPEHRLIRVRTGPLTMTLSGPTSGIYDRMCAYRAKYPNAMILSDEPLAV